MTNADTYRRLPLTISLLCAGMLATWLLLGGRDGPFARWTGLDFHYLFLPLALGGGLLLLNSLLLWAGLTRPAQRIAGRLARAGSPESPGSRLLAVAPLVVRRVPNDLGRMVLALGLISSVALLPATLSQRPGGRDLNFLTEYLEVFTSLAVWGIFLLLPFVLVRAIGEERPVLLEIVRFPRKSLITFAAAYVLLADGGVLDVAFEVQGSGVLVALGVTLGIFYGASVLRNFIHAVQPRRFLPALRAALIIAEVLWLGTLLGAVAALPEAVEPSINVVHSRLNAPPPTPTPTPLPVGASTETHFSLLHGVGLAYPIRPTPSSPVELEPEPPTAELDPETMSAYMGILHNLSNWAVLVLLAFGLVRVVGIFRPTVERVFGFPIARLVILAVVYVTLSETGVVATALGVNFSQAMSILTLALGVSYAGTILRNITGLDIPGRFGPPAARVFGLSGALAQSAAWALAVWVVLNHMPVVNATLLDHSRTRQYGADYLPHFGSLFDLRFTAAALCFATALALSLPRTLVDKTSRRFLPALAALVSCAAGYIIWAAGVSLSSLGHGFVLGGAVVAAGMYSLALSYLATYCINSPNRMLADLAGWLAASKLRGFILGANVAFYGLLLRPVLYDFLWLAALYEYTALLLLMLMVLMRVLNRMRVVDEADGPAAPAGADWSHHLQAIEAKPDRRTELTAALRQRFVDHGEWKPLWTYLMGLLYRGEASLDSIRDACRPLRNSAAGPRFWNLLARWKRNRSRRMTALEESLGSVEQALASSVTPLSAIHEEALREAAIPYIESGAEQDALAVALISAHCQRGDDVGQAVDRWFELLDAPDPSQGWFKLPKLRSGDWSSDRSRRLQMVEGAISQLFSDSMPRRSAPSEMPA